MFTLAEYIIIINISTYVFFSLDLHGKPQFITQSIHLRDSHFTVDIEKVKPWYRAMKIFVETINNHAAEFKTQPGTKKLEK